MPLSLAGANHGSNDENPTFPAMSALAEADPYRHDVKVCR